MSAIAMEFHYRNRKVRIDRTAFRREIVSAANWNCMTLYEYLMARVR
jgi:hypothetical protein